VGIGNIDILDDPDKTGYAFWPGFKLVILIK
jgi:hypothetical protein